MLILINTLVFALIYVVLVAFMLSKPGFESEGNSDEDDGDNGRGDGGWDDSDDKPPLDLPPGVFILPPDADDPCRRKSIEDEAFA